MGILNSRYYYCCVAVVSISDQRDIGCNVKWCNPCLGEPGMPKIYMWGSEASRRLIFLGEEMIGDQR